MEPISTAFLATALFEVAQKLAEKGILDPALEKGLEPFKKWLTSGYDAKKAEEELRKATLAALDEARAQVGDPFERLKIVNTLTDLSPDAHQMLAACAVEMARPDPAKIPVELLHLLELDTPDRDWLARYLAYLRRHLAGMDSFRPLIEYADELERQNKLDGLSAQVAQMVSDARRMKTLLELLAADRRLTENDPQALEEYITETRASLGTLVLPFVRQGPASSATTHLNKVFVPLYVRDEKAEEQARKKAEKRQQSRLDLKSDEQDVRPVDFNTLFARYERFILIGLPGTGKTTLLRRAGLAFAEGRAAEDLGWKGRALLPIFIRLRNFGSFLAKNSAEFCEPASGALVTYLERSIKIGERRSLPPDFFDRRLSEGGCLVLLDGLDEVTENRVEVAHYVQKFIEKYGKKGNRIGLSSRPKGYDEDARARLKDADLALAEVTPLQPEGIRQLIENLLLMDAEGRRKYKDDLNRLSDRVLGNRKLTEIAGVPLFCSALVQVYKYHGIDLPQRRVDVLAEIADLLLGFWHGQKDVAQSQTLAQEDGTGQHYDGTQESVEFKRNRLAHLAYVMQTELKAVEISEMRAQKELAHFLEQNEGASPTDAKRWAKGFLRNSHDRSGILVEISPGIFSFIHKNFMEYFAATALIKDVEDPIQTVLDILDDDPTWWDEMIAFAGAHPAGLQLYKKWTPSILNAAAQLPRGSDGWLRRLSVAGILARDMTNRLPHAQKQEVQKALYQAATDGALPAQVRATLADALDEVGLPRELENELYSFVRIVGRDNISPYYLAKYPVTNAQYARFLQPENFANKDLWVNFPKFDENGQPMKATWGAEGWQWLQGALKEASGKILEPRYWRDARFGLARPNAPLVGISWYEVNAYCKWLAQNWQNQPEAESLSAFITQPSALTFRLPTENEWVLAAGGAENNRFAWDTDEATDKEAEIYQRANVNMQIGRTTPVWMYPQGASEPHKLMDMSGNVWEWQANYRNKKNGWLGLRGGSWSVPQDFARVSYRSDLNPLVRYDVIGFRVAAFPSE